MEESDHGYVDNPFRDGRARQRRSICAIDGAFDVYQSIHLAEEHNLIACSPVSGVYQVRVGVIEAPPRTYRDL